MAIKIRKKDVFLQKISRKTTRYDVKKNAHGKGMGR